MSQPSVKKNYIYSFLYQILTMITPFITAPYVSRVLGADGVGIYSYAQSYMNYFILAAALGTTSYGMREIAQCRNKKEEYSKKFWEIELLTVFTTFVCLFAWIVLILYSSTYKPYFIALVPSLLATMFDISWFYTGNEKIGYTVFWNVFCKIVGVICIFAFIKNKDDVVLYIFLNSFILMLGNISMWVFLPRMLVKVNPREFKLKKHLHETLIYFIPTIATTVYTVLDKTLIGVITQDSYQNGYYEQATKIVNMAKTAVFVSVNKVMEARISYLFVENKIDEIKERTKKSLSYILLLAFGSMFGIIGIARDFVPLFFGQGYEPVILLLYLMSPLVVIIGFSNCLGSHYYTPAGLRTKSARYLIIGCVINLVCNLILIPYYKSYGAVIGSLIAESTISVLYLKNCNHLIEPKKIWSLCYKKIISGVVMMFIIWSISSAWSTNSILMIVIEIFIGVITYFALLILLKDRFILDSISLVKKKYLVKKGK